MRTFSSINDILDFAIENERESFSFYTDLALTVGQESVKALLADFAREEDKHRERLEAVRRGNLDSFGQVLAQNLKIADYLVDVEPYPDMEYQDALIVAMNKEKAAFKLYMDLSSRISDAAMKSLFLALAQEEAKHKLVFEIEYDDVVYNEN